MDPDTASGPALRTFLRIAECWDLEDEERLVLLGAESPAAYIELTRGRDVALPRETLERISYVLGIFKALNILLPDEQAADSWLRKPNEALLFAGSSALSRMLSGRTEDLKLVRQYLDAQRGGWS